MKRAAVVLILLASTLTASCKKNPELPQLPTGAVILAFGDSLTFGTGAAETESYPAVLEKAVGIRVVNAGVPGEISAKGVQRLPELLEQEKPALMILCHGGNDLLGKLDRKALEDNLRTMIRMSRDKGVAVLLIAVPSPGLSLAPPPLYAEVATEFAVPLEADSLSTILGKNSLKSDHIHPNAAGYRLLAKDILKLLKKSGAVP